MIVVFSSPGPTQAPCSIFIAGNTMSMDLFISSTSELWYLKAEVVADDCRKLVPEAEMVAALGLVSARASPFSWTRSRTGVRCGEGTRAHPRGADMQGQKKNDGFV
jgi:hypothetical protein